MAWETHFNETVQSEYFGKVFRYAKVDVLACRATSSRRGQKKFGEQSEWSRDSEREVIGKGRDAALPGAGLQTRSQRKKILKGTSTRKSQISYALIRFMA